MDFLKNNDYFLKKDIKTDEIFENEIKKYQVLFTNEVVKKYHQIKKILKKKILLIYKKKYQKKNKLIK